MRSRLVSWNWYRPKYLAIIFTCFVFMAAILGNSPIIEAKDKKATVTVTVENFRPDEKKLEYKVYKSGTQELIGKKIFAANKIETDEPDFSLKIKYDAKGMNEGSRMDICVHRLSFDKSTYCYYGLELQAGISPGAMIDIGSPDNGGSDGNNIPSNASVSIVFGSSSPNNGQYFVPYKFTISEEGKVIWINDDDTLHTVVSATSQGGNSKTEFDSGYIAAGKTFGHRFTSKGTFDYYCALHPFMKGQVTVK